MISAKYLNSKVSIIKFTNFNLFGNKNINVR